MNTRQVLSLCVTISAQEGLLEKVVLQWKPKGGDRTSFSFRQNSLLDYRNHTHQDTVELGFLPAVLTQSKLMFLIEYADYLFPSARPVLGSRSTRTRVLPGT